MQRKQMLENNVDGFLGILQNPENSPDDRQTAAKFLKDLVERLRRKKYLAEFKNLEDQAEDILLENSRSMCDNFKGAEGHPKNYESCQ